MTLYSMYGTRTVEKINDSVAFPHALYSNTSSRALLTSRGSMLSLRVRVLYEQWYLLPTRLQYVSVRFSSVFFTACFQIKSLVLVLYLVPVRAAPPVKYFLKLL